MSRKVKNNIAVIDSGQYLSINKRTVFYLLMVLGIYWVFSLYSAVLSPLILGALLAYLLYPFVLFLTKKTRLSSNLSALIVFLGFLVMIFSITRFSAPILYKQFKILNGNFQIISNEIIELQPVLDKTLGIDVPLDKIVPELEGEIEQFLKPTRLFRVIQSATDNVVWAIVTFMICFYFLKDWLKLKNWTSKIAPNSLRTSLESIHEEINLVWQTYLRGQLLMMLLIGVLSGIGGVAVGLRSAIIIGVLAGALALIPSLGPAIATFIAGMTAWTQGSLYLDMSNFLFAILVCGIFIFIQFIEGIFLQPKIMSRRMKLHPAVVFVAVVSTLSLFGVIAGLIVIPVIGSLEVIIRYSIQHLNGYSKEKDIP